MPCSSWKNLSAMSKVKKMKLVPFESNETKSDNDFLIKNLLSERSPQRRQINYLDDEMKSILDSNLDEESKFKLFTQSLRKYTLIKNKLDENNPINQNANIVNPNSTLNSLSSATNSTTMTPINLLQPLSSQANLTSTPKSITPKSINTPRSMNTQLKSIKKQRAVKTKAISRIKKILAENTSSEDESTQNWKPYHAPKNIKRLRSKRVE